MKRFEMIKDQKMFNSIIHCNNFILNKHFVIYIKKKSDNLAFPKFGIAISKKFGNAVTRNKYKRITRSIIDKTKYMFKNTEDYIIMIRKDAQTATFEELETNFEKLLKKRNRDEKKV